jgi:hypothetical protein
MFIGFYAKFAYFLTNLARTILLILLIGADALPDVYHVSNVFFSRPHHRAS